jgi:serine/threonine-protein kinase
MLYPGDRVKDYEVIAPLRSGGMAMLYLARRRGVGGFSRLVALKLVHPHLLRDASITRLFLQEARISANVAHPNVVSVEEIGETGGSYFIAMEYVHGVSLAELLTTLREKRLRMSPKLCVWVTAQIAEALHAVHEATGENGVPLQIVHRDVSPQNVLVGHTGHVKLIDFGIAKSCSRGHQTAGNGPAVLGKLRYMAPEQLRSEPADRRTDVYALGVMLWELLAARSLYRCQSVDDERDWVARENPLPPGKYTTRSTPALDRAVVKALACAREHRYTTALEFRTALLHAEPSAAQIDAPMFAAMMSTMLGNKLERLRAALPSEVSMQLARDAEDTASRARSADGLTAQMGSSDDAANPFRPDDDDENADEPTSIAPSPAESTALRSGRRARLSATLESPLPAEPETGPTAIFASEALRVPTEPSPTYLISSPSPNLRTTQLWMLRAAVGMVCLAVGIAAGALASGVGLRSKSSAHASGAPTAAAAGLTPRVRLSVRPEPSSPPSAERSDAKPTAALGPDVRTDKADDSPPRIQRPTAATTLARSKRSVASSKGGALRTAKLTKGSAAGGRKSKTPMNRKLKNAVR